MDDKKRQEMIAVLLQVRAFVREADDAKAAETAAALVDMVAKLDEGDD